MTDRIRSSALTGYRRLVAKLGGDADSLLQRAGIAPGALEVSDELISFRSMVRLLEATAITLACPDFGMQLALEQDMRILGPVGIIGLNSPTVRDAIADMIEHIGFYSPAILCRIDEQTDPRRPLLTYDLRFSGEPHKRQTIELAMCLFHRHMQTLTHGQGWLETVLFRHATPLPQSTYRHYFGTAAQFSQPVNALVVRAEDLRRPLENTDAQLRRVMTDYLRQFSTSNPFDFRCQVEQLIRRLLPSGRCNLQYVAGQLHLHERTLQRRLTQLNLHFEDMVESVRRERAEELLSESKLSMAQIAEQLGYLDQSSLNRACRRWFSTAPRQIKALHRPQPEQ
ncbi:MAG: AraC family transcriptional regulator [Hydrocarboniphaga sp.]|uniref:AraC family transcriptional regulator n=1 Tax=Hydrocarboniphaga sp. TaxID=2033016 RepID=UPI00262ECF0A|nr:AraC family transcriptional regulator [Hydrocarboniphaga sp.]MDB5968402.1 AraC family transcriptional regulator [Hydrocarboniphaga sp.]